MARRRSRNRAQRHCIEGATGTGANCSSSSDRYWAGSQRGRFARLEDKAIPAAVLNELIQCNAVRTTGAVVELQHEGLADYLRAKPLRRGVSPSCRGKSRHFRFRQIPSGLADGAARQPQAQSALWRRMSAGRISIYLDALRYRFDVSNQLRELDSDSFPKTIWTTLLTVLRFRSRVFSPRCALPSWGGLPASRTQLLQQQGAPEHILARCSINCTPGAGAATCNSRLADVSGHSPGGGSRSIPLSHRQRAASWHDLAAGYITGRGQTAKR